MPRTASPPWVCTYSICAVSHDWRMRALTIIQFRRVIQRCRRMFIAVGTQNVRFDFTSHTAIYPPPPLSLSSLVIVPTPMSPIWHQVVHLFIANERRDARD